MLAITSTDFLTDTHPVVESSPFSVANSGSKYSALTTSFFFTDAVADAGT